MPNTHATLGSLFSDIADAIRSKTGTSDTIKADNFPDAINNIDPGTDTSDATGTATDLLSGKTMYGANGKVTGTIATKTSSDIATSGATVTVPAGYYASQVQKAVSSGTAGTPTATKGTVSNHSITVTPSVTNTTGYITGGTKTGTAVTVTASELVSDTLTVTENGTVDCTNYASVNVNYPQAPITVIIPAWVSGASITYKGTTYTSGNSITAYAPDMLTITMPAAGTTCVINGVYYTLQGTSFQLGVFSDMIIYMSGTSPYRIDIGSISAVGGKVPINYIFRAWESYTGLKNRFSNFTYRDILITEDNDYITFFYLLPNFTLRNYNEETGAFEAYGTYRAQYNKSTGEWELFNASTDLASIGGNFSNAVFSDTIITFNNRQIFPVRAGEEPTELATLFAPTISLDGNTLTITNSASNGDFATQYKIYDGNTLLDTISTNEATS